MQLGNTQLVPRTWTLSFLSCNNSAATVVLEQKEQKTVLQF